MNGIEILKNYFFFCINVLTRIIIKIKVISARIEEITIALVFDGSPATFILKSFEIVRLTPIVPCDWLLPATCLNWRDTSKL